MINNWVSQLQLFPPNIYYVFISTVTDCFLGLDLFWDFNLNDHLNPPDVPEILLWWAIFHLWLLKTETTWAVFAHEHTASSQSLLSLRGRDGPFTLCYLTFAIPVATWGPSVDWAKSSVTTLSLPSLRMQRCTARRTFCSLRSSAKRWGSVRIGCKASFSRDSLMTSLSLYAGRDNSCSRNSVELFILRNNHRTSFSSWNLPKSLHQPKRHSHAALGQWWQDGNLILRVLPKPGRKIWWRWKKTNKAEFFSTKNNWDFFLHGASSHPLALSKCRGNPSSPNLEKTS